MTLVWNWPQITWGILAVLGIFGAVISHGKAKTGTNNGGSTVLGLILMFALLYYGGFFAGATP